MPISHGKKGQNNYFPYLPSGTTGQNQASIRPTTSGMGENFLNGQAPIMNGDLRQNFPSMNVRERQTTITTIFLTELFSSFSPVMMLMI